MIRDDEMRHLETLARLRLDDAERQALKADLNAILDYVERLREVDTEGVEGLVRPVQVSDVYREDVVTACLEPEAVEALAVATHEGLVRVPRTVDEGN